MRDKRKSELIHSELTALFGERWNPRALVQWKDEMDIHKEQIESLAARLMSKRWLPFVALNPRKATIGELAERFGESFEKLRRCFAEVDGFARLICRVNIVASSDRARLEAKVSEQKLRAIAEKLRQRLPKRSPLRIDLIQEVFEEAKGEGKGERHALVALHERLMDELHEMARDTARYLFQTLDSLVEKELVGLIHWRGKGLCTFSFFTNEVAAHVTKEERDEDRAITHGRSVHRHVRHDHELVEGKEHSLPGPQSLLVPEAQAALMKGIPDWIEPLCRVVDGTQVLERQTEVDVEIENWREVRRVEPVIKQVVQPDPAITLGSLYVLTGWGKLESDAELKRRRDVAAEKKWRFLKERARKVRNVVATVREHVDGESCIVGMVAFTFFVPGVCGMCQQL